MNSAPAAVILDCDGVIFDSNLAKVEAFRQVARDAGVGPQAVQKFSEWQSGNFGLSRYRVFEALLEGRFGAVPDDASLDGLLESFAEECREIYLRAAETRGLRTFLDAASGVPLYVASGSDEAELRVALAARGLATRFVAILGSPRPKSELLADIVARVGSPSNVVMVGDAHADLEAARSTGIDFVFVSGYSTVRASMTELAKRDGFPRYDDLGQLALDLFPAPAPSRPPRRSGLRFWTDMKRSTHARDAR